MYSKYGNEYLPSTYFDTSREKFIYFLRQTILKDSSILDEDITFRDIREYNGPILDENHPDFTANTQVEIITNGITLPFKHVRYHRYPATEYIPTKEELFSKKSILSYRYSNLLNQETYTQDIDLSDRVYTDMVNYFHPRINDFIESAKLQRYSDGKPTGYLCVKLNKDDLVYQGTSFNVSLYPDVTQEELYQPYSEVKEGASTGVYYFHMGDLEKINFLDGVDVRDKYYYRRKITIYQGDVIQREVYTLPFSVYMGMIDDYHKPVASISSTGELEINYQGVEVYSTPNTVYIQSFKYQKVGE